MKKKLFLLFALVFLMFSSCSFVEQVKREISHPVDRVLGITPELEIKREKIFNELTNRNEDDYYLYTKLGDKIICNYHFAPDEDFNCNEIKVSFSDPSVLELIEVSIEDKQFIVKSINYGYSNITVTTDTGDKNTTMRIKVF